MTAPRDRAMTFTAPLCRLDDDELRDRSGMKIDVEGAEDALLAAGAGSRHRQVASAGNYPAPRGAVTHGTHGDGSAVASLGPGQPLRPALGSPASSPRLAQDGRVEAQFRDEFLALVILIARLLHLADLAPVQSPNCFVQRYWRSPRQCTPTSSATVLHSRHRAARRRSAPP